MCAIGISVVPKRATICSDHFDQNFHQTDGYTTVRRLLPNAVPSIIIKAKPSDSCTITASNNEDCKNNESVNDDSMTISKVLEKDDKVSCNKSCDKNVQVIISNSENMSM